MIPSGLYNITDDSKVKRMKDAIEAMRNKETGSYKAFSTYHKQHFGVMLKTGRKAQIKQ